jgi:hypothetical protein
MSTAVWMVLIVSVVWGEEHRPRNDLHVKASSDPGTLKGLALAVLIAQVKQSCLSARHNRYNSVTIKHRDNVRLA